MDFLCVSGTHFLHFRSTKKNLYLTPRRKKCKQVIFYIFCHFPIFAQSNTPFFFAGKGKEKGSSKQNRNVIKVRTNKKTFLNCKKSIFFLLAILANIVNVKITITSEKKIGEPLILGRIRALTDFS
jgi:hypothetical protein